MTINWLTLSLCLLGWAVLTFAVWGIVHGTRRPTPPVPARRKPFAPGVCPSCQRPLKVNDVGDPVRRHRCVAGSPWDIRAVSPPEVAS